MIKLRWSVRKKVVLTVISAALAVIIVTAIILVLKQYNDQQVVHKAAIVTNGLECAGIASKILRDAGSAVDAAISTLLCEGVASPQSCGLGGGFVMTIYHKETNKVETLIARDSAPLAATKDMFVNTTVTGGKAVSVPGELKGYWELHRKYGKLEWGKLLDPVIELCKVGHTVSPYLANILNTRKNIILGSPTLSEVYINPKTNDVYQAGDLVKRPRLADTLKIIKKEGVDTIYNGGQIGRTLIDDIQAAGGIMTLDDLKEYNVRWEKPISTLLKDNKKLHTLSLPGSGALVAFIMNVLDNYLPEKESATSMQRIAEAFKFAYAERTLLGDKAFVESSLQEERKLLNLTFAAEIRKQIEDLKTYQDYEHYGANFSSKMDQGTSHINIIAPNGDAIAATTTINSIFGNKIVSRTGIILNDGMDDFAVPGKKNGYGLPPSPSNFILPKKMPLSSMCPTILLDENDNVELILGAAGGSKITSSVAYVLLRYLYFKESVEDAVHAPRIHHQLAPMELSYEEGISDEIVDGLRNIGHAMKKASSDLGFAALTAIGREGQRFVPVYDHRRKGGKEVF